MSIKKKKWELNKSDVGMSTSSSSRSGRSGSLSRSSRKVDTRSLKVTLRHVPTGVEVSKEIPEGNYSKKEMQKQKNEVATELQEKLEDAVAKILRIPGR